MGNRCSKTKVDVDYANKQLEAPPDFQGPTDKRRCTDVFFAFVLIAVWALMTMLGMHVTQNGDYRLLINPIDYNGNVCGLDNTERNGMDMTNYKYLYPVNFYGGGVCVEECPKVPGSYIDPFVLVTYGGVYDPFTKGSSWSSSFVSMPNYNSTNSTITRTCNEDKCFPTIYGQPNPVDAWSSLGVNEGYGYAFYLVDTESYLKNCLITKNGLQKLRNITEDLLAGSNSTVSTFKDKTNFVTNLYSDVYTARHYVFGFGFAVAVIIGFLYLSLLRIPCVLPFITWSSILLTLAGLGYIGYYAYLEQLEWLVEDPPMHTSKEIIGLKIFAYCLWVCAFLLLMLTFYVRRRIMLAIGLVKESSRAISTMSVLTVFPAFQSAAMTIFAVVWLYYAINLASMGEYATTDVEMNEVKVTFRSFNYDASLEQAGWFLLFCFFWTTQFVMAVGEMLVALSVARWFFNKEHDTVGNSSVFKSLSQILFYHTGTAALGSLLIALVSMIRAFFMYLEAKVSKAGNKYLEVLLKCIQVVLCCLDKAIKYLNKNAYIQCAIFSTNLCVSAREAFFLILRNAARVGTLAVISEILVFIGKIFIAVMAGGLSYIVMDKFADLDLYSPIGPVLLIMVISYLVGNVFMGVFSMVVSTMLQCFIADEEMFGEFPDARFTPKSLRSWVNEYEKNPHKVPIRKNLELSERPANNAEPTAELKSPKKAEPAKIEMSAKKETPATSEMSNKKETTATSETSAKKETTPKKDKSVKKEMSPRKETPSKKATPAKETKSAEKDSKQVNKTKSGKK